MGESAAAKLKDQAPRFAPDRLARIAKRLVETEQQLRTGEGTPLPLELAVLELTTASVEKPPAAAAGPAAAPSRARPQPIHPAPPPSAKPEARASTPRTEGGAASPAVELGAVRVAWMTVAEKTRERNVGIAAHLLAAEPVAIDGTTVIVGFADDFARGRVDKQRTDVERDLSGVLGTEVRVRCVRQAAPATAAPATEDPMLRAALETFRRPERILEVE
ncbi:MAG: hypothetical protein LC663_06315 [Actinobacteria bacterium]|nr:hypothetical protein [Actinomycetota bacterium]